MRLKFLVIMVLLVGLTSASSWYPRSADYNTTGDVNADNGAFSGDLSVTGTISAGVATVSDGVYDGNFRLAADHWLYSTTGTGGIDFSNATGTWKSSTGTNTIGGHLVVPAAKISYLNTTIIPSGKTAYLNATVATTVVAEDLHSTDDAYVGDDCVVDGGLRVDETLTTNALVINTTADINGATTTAAITVDSGSIVTADQFKRRTSTTATNTTITDGGADVYLVGNGTGVNTQTITFPTAADNKGRVITVILATDPLTNTVILDGEGSEQIDGATTKTTTDAVGSMYHLICNGVGWIKLVSSGTWS